MKIHIIIEGKNGKSYSFISDGIYARERIMFIQYDSEIKMMEDYEKNIDISHVTKNDLFINLETQKQ